MTSANEERTHLTSATYFGRPSAVINVSLGGGVDGRVPTAGQKHGAYTDHFADAETIDVSFLIVGSTRTDNGSGNSQDILADHNTIVNNIIQIAENRKDCMVIASPRRASVRCFK